MLFSAVLAAFAAATLLATGLVEHVVLTGQDAPKDADLVASLVGHAVLGVAVTLVQGGAAIVAGRLLLADSKMPAMTAFLYGLPASLVLLAVACAAMLLLPWGSLLVAAGLAALLLLLRRDIAQTREWRALATRIGALAIPSIAFGIWLGLLWHGPTASLPAWPAGDQVFYSTLVNTLAFDPWPLRNWGNEGEFSYPFNLLWPAVGAALSKVIGIEPFAFIVSAGASAFVFGTALALRAYAVATQARYDTRGIAILALGLLAAGRYPFWIVESPPMIHVVGLTIAVWFWATRSSSALTVVAGTAGALAGTLLTKVACAATLVPLALSPFVPAAARWSRGAKIALFAMAALVVLIGAWLVVTFGPRLLAVGGIRPEGWKASWPFVLRDLGTMTLAAAALIGLRWWTAIPIALGLLTALVVPFTMRGVFVSAVVLIALAFAGGPGTPTPARAAKLVVVGLALCVPAMLFKDPGGRLTGFVWAACMVLALRAALAPDAWPGTRLAAPQARARLPGLTKGLAGAALVLFLFATAAGRVGMSSNWVNGRYMLSPQIYELWHTVPQVVPRDALVFTDQTGTDWGLLEGWNTYAFFATRQFFLSTWVQSGELQADEKRRNEKLRWNFLVLDGALPPTAVPLRGTYASFYAVVAQGRVPGLSTGWVVERDVGPYAILRWRNSPPTDQERAR